MSWSLNASSPIWMQLCQQIEDRVLTGQYPQGERLPSVRDLAAEAGVNPNTMQRALTELEREGLLLGGGTSGRTVTAQEEVLSAARDMALNELAKECAEKFMVFGLTPKQAAELLKALEE